ncbi:TfoX/Sxy family protein [Marinomonas transparens]|uniref:TfoX/Sxy family protein n=1 Tax=Marinomonas transparens TaxID=2795388 RepID=A0A934N2X0_9GAMM|nr:TfoX/Sxy family protein [Marinomonas transparens]MBJ7539122.1 TfoX/Sxy family protein [Marinomonas transparens]
MAFDEGLAERVRGCFTSRNDVVEKKMFGGLCFMVSDHMCCGIVGDTLMGRVGPDNYEECLNREHVSKMDFTGKSMKGMIYVSAEGVAEDETLQYWVGLCLSFVTRLPPKKPK